MPNDRKTMLTLHELRVEEAAIPVLVDSNGAAFPVKTYSEFKLGAVAVAAGWGLRLADLFLAEAAETVLDRRAPVILLPPTRLPNSALVLARFFVTQLNSTRLHLGLEPAQRLRSRPGHTDARYTTTQPSRKYSRMSLPERESFFREYPAAVTRTEALFDRHVVVIDDLIATGTTSRVLASLAMAAGAGEVILGAVARLRHEDAISHPHVEAAMNGAALTSTDCLATLIAIKQAGGWTPTSTAIGLLRTISPDDQRLGLLTDGLTRSQRHVLRGALRR